MSRAELVDQEEWDRTYVHGGRLVTEALRALGGSATTDELFETPPLSDIRYPEAAKEASIDKGFVGLGRFGTTLVLMERTKNSVI